jgi:amino acid transporter
MSSLQAFGYKQELKRSLGLFDLLIYGLVFISPTAPFPTFGIVYNHSHGMVPLVYVVGFVAMLFTAISYMTMARTFPLAEAGAAMQALLSRRHAGKIVLEA